MFQANSENNLLLKDQCNFDESFVMTPVNLNPVSLNFGKPKSRNFLPQSKQRLGDYEDFKLTPYLYRGLNNQFIDMNVPHDSKLSQRGNTIQVINIDPSSLVVEIGHQFIELMSKYSTMNVCFVSVTGQRQSGKSFFCDKLLNLAEVKGNNFALRKNPGVYTYPFPFVKDDLYIFFLQIAGCDLNSDVYNKLNTLCLIISQCYVFVPGEKNLSKSHSKFVQSLNYCWENILDTKEKGVNNPQSQTILPQTFYSLQNSLQNKNDEELKTQICKKFKQMSKEYIPIASNPSHNEKKQDLSLLSFLARDYINPEYVKQCSKIFKSIYDRITEKRYTDLLINGNIVNKLLFQAVSNLNSKKKVKICKIYQNIIKQLYISAYNYCVLGYHEELEAFFEDQQPKNSDQMYDMFQKASERAIQKFNQFNLSKNLHEEYEQKLLNHIQKKQDLLSSINKQKTQEYLAEQLTRFQVDPKDDLKTIMNQLKNYRGYLDDGRSEALTEKMVQIFKLFASGTNNDAAFYKKIQELTQEKQILKQKLSNQQIMQQLDREIKNLSTQIQKSTQKRNELKNINFQADRIAQLKEQIEKLTEKQVEVSSNLRTFKQQNHQGTISQIRESYTQKINNLKKKEAQIQKQIQLIEKQAPKPESKKDISKNKQSDVKKPADVKKK